MAYHPYYQTARNDFPVPSLLQPLIASGMNGGASPQQNVAANSFNYHHLSHPGSKNKSFSPTLIPPSPSAYHGSMIGASNFAADDERPKTPQGNVKLENRDLWESFNKHGTEMVITKAGR